MSLWVRNNKRLNMNRSQAISRDARAVRNDCATQEPRRAVRITRLLFEIPILCLRCSRLQRKSTKNRSTIHKNEAQIDQTSTKIRTGAGLGAQGRFGDASGRARDGFWTPKCRPKTYLGASRAAQERPVAPQDASRRPRHAPDASPKRPGSLTKPDCGTERSSRPASINL